MNFIKIRLVPILAIVVLIMSSKCLAQDKGYWQQQVNYKINVQLNDQKHELSAFESIEYTNNSPAELKEIYFHLWPNAYKDTKSAFAKQQLENRATKFRNAKENDRGYIDSLDFKVNGMPVKLEYDKKHIDICKIILNEPLLPGAKINISTPFRVKIPYSYSRLGHIETSYQLTQWFPKPAVYDQTGWHPMPYLDQGEFYSEFGSFEVSITLPKNYVVGATGDLQNEDELAWLTKKAEETAKINSFDKKNLTHPASEKVYKTLVYKQSKVHDFAWFADKRFHVLKGEVELPYSKRKVTTWTLFTNAYADYWKKSIPYMNDAIYYYSLWNGDYPYNQATALESALSAGAGMEYPNVTVIGKTSSDISLETVIVHEVGHNWFYGILGSNERDNPWMDEGINTYNEQRYLRTKYPDAKLLGKLAKLKIAKRFDMDRYPLWYQNTLLYLFAARTNQDQAIQGPSADYTQLNYGAIVYGKTGLAFRYLENYLGTPLFDSCMHTYYDRWKFRHPQPNDIKVVFEEVSGKDLSWFFNNLINTTEKIDFSVKKIKKENNELRVQLNSKSSFAAPAIISALGKNDSVISTQLVEPFSGNKELQFSSTGIKKIRIDHEGVIPEINQKNNTIRSSGLLKKLEPLRIQRIASVENRNKTQIFYSPIVGYNYNDGWMPGIAFYNSFIPAQKFEYVLAPMYGIKSEKFTGTGRVAYNWYPNKIFSRITLATNYSEFSSITGVKGVIYTNLAGNSVKDPQGSYRKIAPSLELELPKNYQRSPVKQLITLRSVYTEHRTTTYLDGISILNVINRNDIFNKLSYNLSNIRVINPYSLSASLEQSESFAKATIEGEYTLTYPKKKTGLNLRVFAGQFLFNDAGGVYGFRFDDANDYTFDQVYLDRSHASDRMLSKQFASTEGGFKQYAYTADASNWMLSLNIKTPLVILPIGVYGDLGLSSTDNLLHSDVGFYIPVIKNIFEIYFPAYTSAKNPLSLSYSQRIRYVLNLNKLNPFTLIRNASL